MREMKPWVNLLVGLAIALFGALAGYSLSQSRLAGIVAEHGMSIRVNERDIERYRLMSAEHMRAALESWDRQVEATRDQTAAMREALALIREQHSSLIKEAK